MVSPHRPGPSFAAIVIASRASTSDGRVTAASAIGGPALNGSADGKTPYTERIVSDHDDAAEPKVLFALRGVEDKNASHILDPAPDHAPDEHDGRAGIVGRGEQRPEVSVCTDEDPAVVPSGLE